MILGSLDTPNICSERWYSRLIACVTFENHLTTPYGVCQTWGFANPAFRSTLPGPREARGDYKTRHAEQVTGLLTDNVEHTVHN